MKIEERINLMVEVSKEDWMNKAVFKDVPNLMKDIKKMASKNEYKYAIMKIDSIIDWMKTLRDLYQIKQDDQI